MDPIFLAPVDFQALRDVLGSRGVARASFQFGRLDADEDTHDDNNQLDAGCSPLLLLQVLNDSWLVPSTFYPSYSA